MWLGENEEEKKRGKARIAMRFEDEYEEEMRSGDAWGLSGARLFP